uniref:Uncharacterized protein n=1 Tax=Timema genevievae TaxID=629358 RepID=A0A7R9K215_TIMGE|nr:unnamed protein product [Timema genevievae]
MLELMEVPIMDTNKWRRPEQRIEVYTKTVAGAHVHTAMHIMRRQEWNYTNKLHKIIKDTAHDTTARKELSQLIL